LTQRLDTKNRQQYLSLSDLARCRINGSITVTGASARCVNRTSPLGLWPLWTPWYQWLSGLL